MPKFSQGTIFFDKDSADFLQRVIVPNLNLLGHFIILQFENSLLMDEIATGGHKLLFGVKFHFQVVVERRKANFYIL